MFNSTIIRLVCILITLFTFACSGGGGGGDDSGGSGSNRGVRLLHGVIEAAPVRMQFLGNEGDFLTRTDFRNASGYFPLDEGGQTVQVFRQEDLSNPAVSARATINPEARYSLIFHGARTTLGLRASLVEDNIPEEIGGDMIAVKFVHALVGASSISPRVGGVAASVIGFGGATEYQLLPAAESLPVQVIRTVDQQSVVNQSLALAPGKAHTILVTGEVGALVTINNFQDN